MYGTALETLRLLEWRLARLEFYLISEEKSQPPAAEESVSIRLSKLQDRFAAICSRQSSAEELLKLHARLPEISSENTREESDSSPSSLNKLQIVLSSASTYPATVSSLNALQECPIPETKAFISLIALQPSLQAAQTTQERQLRDVQDLTRRSARLLAKWYQFKILEGGEQWSDWEYRLGKVEQTIRRMETSAAKQQQDI